MNILLISSTIRGIKSIDKDIKISYVKKNFDDSIFDECHIKTIYGTNGSGKSGIAHAYECFSFLASNIYPLKDPFFVSKFKQLINKKTNEFFIENVFALNLETKVSRYKYSFTVAKNESGELYFKNEKLVSLNKRLDDSEIIYEVDDGSIINNFKNSKLKLNLNSIALKQNTYLRSLFEEINPSSFEEKNDEFNALTATMYFVYNLIVSYGSDNDIHQSIDNKSVIDLKLESNNNNLNFSFFKTISSTIERMKGDMYFSVIKSEEENKYEIITRKLSLFLRKINSNVRDVKIGFKRDGLFSYCLLTFVYDGYEVDYEFESTGVRKLCSLFFSLYSATRGKIVFIDEIDAGIHDVFLTSLIKYFVLYTDCQLIMTTHHVGVMEVVKELSKSIDILSDECVIETWSKNGDSSPSSLFKKGYLKGTPFNLNPFDFAEVFAEDAD